MVDKGADVHARTAGGFTALLIAARRGRAGAGNAAVERGRRRERHGPGAAPRRWSSPRFADIPDWRCSCSSGGADPNAGEAGYTPLHWAAGSWHSELTGSLRGIETERDEEWRSLNGLRDGKLALVEALLAHGANPDVRLLNHPPQFGFASQRFRVEPGRGPRRSCSRAMDANVAVMDALVAAGADTFAGDRRGDHAADGGRRVWGGCRPRPG